MRILLYINSESLIAVSRRWSVADCVISKEAR